MNQSNSSKQVLLSVIGVAILVVAVVGVSFAFFNYTRTGENNTVRTGTIEFNSTNTLMNIDNVFPIAKTSVASDSTNTAECVVTITGETTYTAGMDFRVTAQDVSSNIGAGTAGKLPVSIQVTNNLTGATDVVTTPYEDGATIATNSVLATGHIPANTPVSGNITIKAYLDSARIAITDTLENGNIAVSGYTNGTTTTWVNGRSVLTTAEWNALATTPATFKVRVEAIETGGQWAYTLS